MNKFQIFNLLEKCLSGFFGKGLGFALMLLFYFGRESLEDPFVFRSMFVLLMLSVVAIALAYAAKPVQMPVQQPPIVISAPVQQPVQMPVQQALPKPTSYAEMPVRIKARARV